MSDTLTVELRDQHGKRNSRRLRNRGKVPAILYGHERENIPLQLDAEELNRVIRHGSRVVDLCGAVQEKVLLRDLQWNTFGTAVLHLDLTRVAADELVEVEVAIELRGDAVGVKEGGVIEQVAHTIEIECPVASIPEKLPVRINDLHLDGSLLASQIELPPGARLLTPADVLIVHCVAPTAEEELAVSGETAEPELIGRKEKAEEDDEQNS